MGVERLSKEYSASLVDGLDERCGRLVAFAASRKSSTPLRFAQDDAGGAQVQMTARGERLRTPPQLII